MFFYLWRRCCEAERWLLVQIPADEQFLKSSDQTMWHRHPSHIQSHLNLLSPPSWCPLWNWRLNAMNCCHVVGNECISLGWKCLDPPKKKLLVVAGNSVVHGNSSHRFRNAVSWKTDACRSAAERRDALINQSRYRGHVSQINASDRRRFQLGNEPSVQQQGCNTELLMQTSTTCCSDPTHGQGSGKLAADLTSCFTFTHFGFLKNAKLVFNNLQRKYLHISILSPNVAVLVETNVYFFHPADKENLHLLLFICLSGLWPTKIWKTSGWWAAVLENKL